VVGYVLRRFTCSSEEFVSCLTCVYTCINNVLMMTCPGVPVIREEENEDGTD